MNTQRSSRSLVRTLSGIVWFLVDTGNPQALQNSLPHTHFVHTHTHTYTDTHTHTDELGFGHISPPTSEWWAGFVTML